MPDKKELKEEDLNDEELKKIAGGGDITNVLATCPRCGNNCASALWDLDTNEVFDISCTWCGLGIWS